MPTENTPKRERRELEDLRERNTTLCETAKRLDAQLCEVLVVLDEWKLPDRAKEGETTRFLTIGERVRCLSELAKGAIHVAKQLGEKVKASQGAGLVGPDGRPLS